MNASFDHEKLEVYRAALTFCGWAGELIATIHVKAAAKDQLDRASTSIPLNIAEGNGKFSQRDRARFVEIARGSALECAACLDVLVVRQLATIERVASGKEQLFHIVRMLMGLLRRLSEDLNAVREGDGRYLQEQEQEQE
ncbi:MAG TPA: four helix bundle protein [Chthoniobacterales bacterium]|jgi:four helix bundle protein|nr:four helix bundle protein [Chthoniobacterales bacterium]